MALLQLHLELTSYHYYVYLPIPYFWSFVVLTLGTTSNHRYKGFNLLSEEDSSLLRHLLNGQFLTQGFSNKALRQLIPGKNSGQISRLLKRPRVHGLIRKVPKRHRYYLSVFGRQAAILALTLRELVIIPHLTFQICSPLGQCTSDVLVRYYEGFTRASRLEWQELRCDIVGVLDKAEGTTQFTEFQLKATPDIPTEADAEKADRLLHRAEKGCLIANSLKASVSLEGTIRYSAVEAI